MTFDQQIASIEKDMRLLRIEFDQFMAGAIRIPPEDYRSRIGKRIQMMRKGRLRTSVERFRLSTLEASFNTLNELHARRLRDIESGRTVRPQARKAGPRLDASRGFQIGEQPDRSAIEALYERLYGRNGRGNKADFGSFEKHVAKQVAKLREKTGCAKVHLRVAREGETLKLKAKPVRKHKEIAK